VNVTKTGKNLLRLGHNVVDRTTELRALASQRFDVEVLGTNRAKFTSKGTWSVAYLTIKGIDGTKAYNVHFDIEYNDTGLTPVFNKKIEYSDEHNLTYLVTINNSASKNGKYFILNNIMLEEGSTASAYEPFGQTYSITFPSSAGTVYGGTLTVNKDGSGKLVVDKAKVALSDLSWAKPGDNYCRANVPFDSNFASAYTKVDAICTHYIVVAQRATGITPRLSFNTKVQIYVEDARIINIPASGLAEYFTGVELVYPLATSTEYSLTPRQVKTLLGTNNIWSDAGPINSITYSSNKHEIIPQGIYLTGAQSITGIPEAKGVSF
jgi:hypothetical protein